MNKNILKYLFLRIWKETTNFEFEEYVPYTSSDEDKRLELAEMICTIE